MTASPSSGGQADSPQYSIAICNYNMSDTIRRCITSIFNRCDERFEVVVVDGGSTDGSRSVLDDLEDEYDLLRVVQLDPDPHRRLGADRRRSIKECRGAHVITHLDADDILVEDLDPYLSRYHELLAERDGPVCLLAGGLTIFPRTLHESYPYRNLAAAEDQDLWRRLRGEDLVVTADMPTCMEEIGYTRRGLDAVPRWFDIQVADFRAGLTVGGYVRYLVRSARKGNEYENDYSAKETLVKLALVPFAYFTAIRRGRIGGTPEEYKRKGDRHLESREDL